MPRRESRTTQLLNELDSGSLIVDDQGLIHWYDPRNGSDSRPWTNSHLTRPLSRELRPAPGPSWPELYRLAAHLDLRPIPQPQSQRILEGSTRGWIATAADRLSGFRCEVRTVRDWQKATVWMARMDPATREVQRAHVRDTSPAEILTWAARIGILGNVALRLRNGTRIRTGEPWQEREVRL